MIGQMTPPFAPIDGQKLSHYGPVETAAVLEEGRGECIGA